ncbi:MAG TPA: hypothetical protein VJ804_15810 [Acidimicrobiales bacterium]|nr:hypothetical protein [Acidimicrobiales bacterium]
MTDASPADDLFHPIADEHPLWTETSWWGFYAPDGSVGGMVYAFFRPNLGVATLVTSIWDADHVEPWRAPYSRSQWHLPMPEGDLDDLALGHLRIRCLEPLGRYHLAYDDPGGLVLDLAYEAAMAPHVAVAQPTIGHFDQLCRATGTIRLGTRVVEVDALAVRDRSWYVRDDLRSSRAGYTYGAVDGDEHFLAFSRPAADGAIHGGYLVRAGEKAALVEGARHVRSRRRGHPDEVEVTAVDALGRELRALGRVTASLASQSTPGMFAWMSIARWDVDGRDGMGEDHDVFSPDLLAAGDRGDP